MNEKLKEKLFALIKEKPANYGQCCGSKAYTELRRLSFCPTNSISRPGFSGYFTT